MKDLEKRILDLEGETEQLSLALESQKLEISGIELAASKKTEEISRETRKKVQWFHFSCPDCHTHLLQASEVDQLKQRLKRYDDYDEIKRELEIMKVIHRPLKPHPSGFTLLIVCRIRWSGRRWRGQWPHQRQ